MATIEDVPMLAAMNHRLIQDEGHRNRMSEQELEARMEAFLRGEYPAAVFEIEGEQQGYALYKSEADWIYIRQFFVMPEKRHRGLGGKHSHGSRLIHGGDGSAFALKCSSATALELHSGNRSHLRIIASRWSGNEIP